MYEPTLFDGFSGIGGFSLAFESVGFRTIGFAEIEPYPSAVLKKHWPDIPNYGRIQNVTPEKVGCFDVFTAGFPCQPASMAGKRRGAGDERFLWSECFRILREFRPEFALFENVPGLLTVDDGRTFNLILSDISSLGYDLLWNCVPACAVGAPHERDRIWIVANSWQKREQRFVEKEIFGEPSLQRGKDVRRLKEEFPRSDVYSPTLCSRINGLSEELGCYGNSIVPQVAQIFAKSIYEILTSNA